MRQLLWEAIRLTMVCSYLKAQNSFDYNLEIQSLTIPDLPGIHSYAAAQSGDKWLVIAGRLDGL